MNAKFLQKHPKGQRTPAWEDVNVGALAAELNMQPQTLRRILGGVGQRINTRRLSGVCRALEMPYAVVMERIRKAQLFRDQQDTDKQKLKAFKQELAKDRQLKAAKSNK